MTNYTLETKAVGNSTFYIQYHDEQVQEKTPPVAQEMTNVFNTSEASAMLTAGAAELTDKAKALQAHIQQISNASASAQMPTATDFLVSSHQPSFEQAMETDAVEKKRDASAEPQASVTSTTEESVPAKSGTKRRRMEKIKINWEPEPVTQKLSDAEQLAANLEKVTAQLNPDEHPTLFLDSRIGRFHDIPALAATCVDSALNANRLTIEGKFVAIASQFPKDTQIEQQLRMYRDNDVSVVLILTPPDEMKKGRAGPMTDYFSESGQYGSIRTQSTAQTPRILSEGGLALKVYSLDIQDGDRDGKRITVLHAQNWPDRTAAGEQDIQTLAKVLPEYGEGLAVHCTAGVGRTGVIMAARIMADPAFAHLSLEEIITLMRRERNGHMVQNNEQLQVLIAIAEAQGRPLLKPLS